MYVARRGDLPRERQASFQEISNVLDSRIVDGDEQVRVPHSARR
jgi:hypothetical protein